MPPAMPAGFRQRMPVAAASEVSAQRHPACRLLLLTLISARTGTSVSATSVPER